MKQTQIIKGIFECCKLINNWLWATAIIALAVFFTVAYAAGCSLNMSPIQSMAIGFQVGVLRVIPVITNTLEKRKKQN